MSRSMIERRELKISPQDTQPENCHFPVGQGKYANSNGHISRMSLAKNGEALKQNGRLRASLFFSFIARNCFGGVVFEVVSRAL